VQAGVLPGTPTVLLVHMSQRNRNARQYTQAYIAATLNIGR